MSRSRVSLRPPVTCGLTDGAANQLHPQATIWHYLHVQATTCPEAPTAADALGMQLIRVAKQMRAVRATAPQVHPAVDAGSYPLLFNLAGDPLRISALAERVHTEMSTVSRAVAGLERAGLLDRIPDPADGRAHLVTLTPGGHAVLANLREQRQAWFTELLHDWSDADVDHLLTLLRRLGDSIETYAGNASHANGIRPERAAHA
ncbi:hypothetical protein GCM10009810_09650 [Nostocoides vanveenii]|jgi:DNA-binding MarR family transcriptional regulator|uniref:HTH marR-type domain-containing protein n=1 Tax=Nostocoides vanveenii TaxID=330835 RepID=A0ABP4WCK3_9MICO